MAKKTIKEMLEDKGTTKEFVIKKGKFNRNDFYKGIVNRKLFDEKALALISKITEIPLDKLQAAK